MTDYATRRIQMVDTQVRPADVTKYPLLEALLSIPRERYVPSGRRETAYMGENVDLGGGRVVLDPRTMAKMLDGLDIQPDELVLDLGCAYGYSAAVIAHLAEAVVAVEPDAAMAAEAQATLSEEGVDNVAVIEGALAAGDARHGPYDVIVLEGGVEQVPAALTDQLKPGGRIAALYMNAPLGTCRIGYFEDGAITWRDMFNAWAPVLAGFERKREFVF